jgi:hypothetical protein
MKIVATLAFYAIFTLVSQLLGLLDLTWWRQLIIDTIYLYIAVNLGAFWIWCWHRSAWWYVWSYHANQFAGWVEGYRWRRFVKSLYLTCRRHEQWDKHGTCALDGAVLNMLWQQSSERDSP